MSSPTPTLALQAGTPDQSIVFDVRRRPSDPSQPLLAQDVGNLVVSLPSPPSTPEDTLSPLKSTQLSNVIASYPKFLKFKQPEGLVSITFGSGNQWRGVLPFDARDTLLIEKTAWDSAQHLREDLVALLELGEELDVSNLVVMLPKGVDGLTELIHSFMYVGGSLVDLTKTNWELKDGYVGVTMQI